MVNFMYQLGQVMVPVWSNICLDVAVKAFPDTINIYNQLTLNKAFYFP